MNTGTRAASRTCLVLGIIVLAAGAAAQDATVQSDWFDVPKIEKW